MKLGSLFDGSGTAPLAATMCGITPVWASEIEPYPIAVTTARFPNMKHLGSVLDINGGEIEPVDIIAGGSPCQDLSVAGKQKGIIEGERSNLFFEMIRVIREMRTATNGIYPRVIIFENVPGIFNSNGGGQTSLKSSASLRGLPTQTYMCLNLKAKTGNLLGDTLGASWDMDGVLLGEQWIANTGEYPSEGVECTLSSVLEANVPAKYYLSSKACQGILRRAERRGKELPPMLKEALEEVVDAG